MNYSDIKLVTTVYEIVRLTCCPVSRERLAFDWRLQWLCIIVKTWRHEDNSPPPPRQHAMVIGPQHSQCFCQRPRACLSWDQSVTSAVILKNSNILTHSWISLTIFNLANTNSLASYSVQWNLTLGESKCRKAIISAHLKNAKLTCLTRPKRALASVIFLGAAKFVILFVILSAGTIESLVKLSPT